MNRSLFFVVLIGLVVLAATLLPATALSLTPEPYAIPPILYAVLIGVLSSFLTEGLKDRFPQIANAIAIMVSALVTTALDFLAGVITTGVDPAFWPLFTQAFLLVASLLSSWATYRIFIKPRKLLEARALSVSSR